MKEKGYKKKHTVGLLLQRSQKKKKAVNEPLHRPLHKRLTKNSQILAVNKATTNHVSLHLWDLPLDAR